MPPSSCFEHSCRCVTPFWFGRSLRSPTGAVGQSTLSSRASTKLPTLRSRLTFNSFCWRSTGVLTSPLRWAPPVWTPARAALGTPKTGMPSRPSSPRPMRSRPDGLTGFEPLWSTDIRKYLDRHSSLCATASVTAGVYVISATSGPGNWQMRISEMIDGRF